MTPLIHINYFFDAWRFWENGLSLEGHISLRFYWKCLCVMDSKTWGWVNDVYPVDYPVKMIIAGHRNGCLMRYERNEKQEKETFIILFSLQIQEDIRIKFCSTEEIHEDGCISAGLVCFGSTVHLLIGVTLILYLKLHFLFLPQKIIWKLYLRASVNSNELKITPEKSNNISNCHSSSWFL